MIEAADAGTLTVRVRYPDGSIAREVVATVADADNDALARMALDLLDGGDAGCTAGRVVELLDLEAAVAPAW